MLWERGAAGGAREEQGEGQEALGGVCIERAQGRGGRRNGRVWKPQGALQDLEGGGVWYCEAGGYSEGTMWDWKVGGGETEAENRGDPESTGGHRGQ